MSSNRSRTLAIAALVLAVGCEPLHDRDDRIGRDERGLINGVVTDRDPAVVAIVLTNEPTKVRCSGTLINERVVLTAAHCGVQLDRAAFRVAFGATIGAGPTIALADAVAHPQYDATATHDLALLLLAERAPVAPVPLAAEPIVAAPPPVPLRLVGFGALDAGGTIDGKKREGIARSTTVDPTFVTLAGDPALPCSGDSGGPVFVTDATGEKLAAVVSRGDAECSSYAKATRVDAHLAAFIQPYVTAHAEGAAAEGERCLYDEQCTTGLCYSAEDDARLSFCVRLCADDSACRAPMTCRAGACRHPVPSPGALGSACTDSKQCITGECLDSGVCARRCVPDRGDCRSGFSCVHLGGIDFYCLADAPAESPSIAGGGGCTWRRATEKGAHERAKTAGVLVLAALVALARRLRSARCCPS